MKPVLHILTDTTQTNWYVEKCLKYADDVSQQFISFEPRMQSLTHPKIEMVPFSEEMFDHWARRANQGEFSKIIVNYFDATAARLISRVDHTSLPIVWIVWGADLYTLPIVDRALYGKETKKILGLTRLAEWRKTLGGLFRKPQQKKSTHELTYSAMKRVTHCATLIEPDVQLIQKCIHPHVARIPFSFSGLEDFAAQGNTPASKNNCIQVGNSGDPANNHADVFMRLKKMGITNPLHVPLSYGNKTYRETLPAVAQEKFQGLKIQFQTQHLSKEDYFKALSSVGFAIMGHYRQQAFANIIALLYFGSKVFLNAQNPLLASFQSWGLHVYDHDLDLTQASLSETLPEEKQKENRDVIERLLGEESMCSYYRNLIAS
ncbi:MAG: TDP-N-acetylfucosamine:lipid II N-acetylfucosaminyltransferase [Flavobacteriales bacterium]